MFTAALFIIIPNCKQPKSLCAGAWVNNVWYIHVIFIKKEPGDDITTRTRSKNIMLKEKKLHIKEYTIYNSTYIAF